MANIAAKELRERLRTSNAAQQLGFKLTRADVGTVALRMRVEERHKQVHGVVHGGVLATLADTAGGLAAYMACGGRRVATIEMKINFLEAVEGGTVEAKAHVIRRGKHIAVVDCDLHDRNGRLVGKALLTFFVGPFQETLKKARR
jgi:uncharacterized protein (TIGR00369 family)